MSKTQIRTDIFMTALGSLLEATATLLVALDKEENEDIGAFDDALEIVLEARNEYCRAFELEIEDGQIEWSRSEAHGPEKESPA